MNLENIRKTNTSDIIFKWLAGCNPISNTTNIITFKEFLSKDHEINEKEFFETFDDLEAADVGYFSSAQANVFHWEYNLKDVAQKIAYPTKTVNIRKAEELMARPKRKIVDVKPLTASLKEVLTTPIEQLEGERQEPMVKKSRGRPKGAKNKLAKERIEKGDTVSKEIIFFFTNRKGNKIPFRLDDVDDLVAQAKEIKDAASSL